MFGDDTSIIIGVKISIDKPRTLILWYSGFKFSVSKD